MKAQIPKLLNSLVLQSLNSSIPESLNLRSGAGQPVDVGSPNCTLDLRSGAGQPVDVGSPNCTRHPSTHSNFIAQTDAQTAYCVLAACALMKRLGKFKGLEQHGLFSRLLGAGVRCESDLRAWMHESFQALNGRTWDACRKRADELIESGVNVFTWDFGVTGKGSRRPTGQRRRSGPQSATCSLFSPWPCPTVLFGTGTLNFDLPLLALFNSRKPRLVSPDSKWLAALRFVFRSLDSREIALATSTGTLTYDMVGALAVRLGLSQLLVAPFPLVTVRQCGVPVLSCMLDSVTCHKKQASICRDRILAFLANVHLLLQIRDGGNLLDVLDKIQEKSPRPQFIFDPGERNPGNAGNYSLLSKYPEHTHRFKLPETPDSAAAIPVRTPSFASPRLRTINWGDYLFHYTRACAGPWLGETYDQYLLNLLDARPLSGHSALETLIRILQEGLVRAGDRMVRGREAVVSWSSHPPHELFLMRKWNRTLARWTVEPYGIAVRRQILRSLGAKPAVYGSEQIYSQLAEPERYRFQLSRSTPSASWRHEREWRLLGDLELGRLGLSEWFVFVPSVEEQGILREHLPSQLNVLVIDAPSGQLF